MIGKQIACMWVIAAAAPLGAQPAGRASYAIGARQVVRALAGQGIHVALSQVTMAAVVVASRPDPELEVLAAGPEAQAPSGTRTNEASWIKLGCRAPVTCLPFYALVANNSNLRAATRAGLRRPEVLHRAASQRSVMAMRAGTHATLVLAGPQARIELAVISLEGGAMGNTIRVATPDYKLFYRAQVVGPDLLKGRF